MSKEYIIYFSLSLSRRTNSLSKLFCYLTTRTQKVRIATTSRIITVAAAKITTIVVITATRWRRNKLSCARSHTKTGRTPHSAKKRRSLHQRLSYFSFHNKLLCPSARFLARLFRATSSTLLTSAMHSFNNLIKMRFIK